MYARSLLVVFSVVSLSQGTPTTSHVKKSDELKPAPYIVGGDIVEGNDYISQVSLQLSEKHICSGSILSPDVIVTAAQCLIFVWQSFKLVEGSNLLSEGTVHSLEAIKVHENFSIRPLHDDIGLVWVSPPIQLKNNSIVKLPNEGQETPSGSKATVIGWGSITGSIGFVNELRKAELETVDQETCQKEYGDYPVLDTHICAASPDGSAAPCYGDVGAPIFVNGEMVGMQSTGKICHTDGIATVFTKMAKYVGWIKENMNAKI